MKTTENSLVGRAFGMVTSSKKAIDALTSKGFKKVHNNEKSTTIIKQLRDD